MADIELSLGIALDEFNADINTAIRKTNELLSWVKRTPAAEVKLKFNVPTKKEFEEALIKRVNDLNNTMATQAAIKVPAASAKADEAASKAAAKKQLDDQKFVNEQMAIWDAKRLAQADKRAKEEAALEDAKNARIVKGAQDRNKALTEADDKARQADAKSFSSTIKARMVAEEDAKKAEEARLNSLPRLRYALYDVANAAKNLSTIATDSIGTVVNAAAEYETAFTRVEQAAGTNTRQAEVLRAQLERLASQIPVTFSDLSGIAALGAQMGIAQVGLEDFTKTIAQFTSVTGVSTETAAKSFGAIGELLGVTSDQYVNLASAIAKAGVESVATESEILSVATQIAGVSSASGLSAQYVVGLSTALASLRVPAEQSRGALTKVFQTVNLAAAEGGQGIANFAAVMGVSADEATRLASADMGTFLNKFLAGLSGVSQQLGPTGLTGVLDTLGLSELRVTNTLTRLAQAPELLAQSMGNSNQAFVDGTFLAEQYGKKIDDIASKFQIIKNNFDTLMATIGAMAGGPIKFALDVIDNLLIGLQNIASSPFGPWILGAAAIVAILVASIGGLISVLALSFAGIFAVRTALQGLAADTKFATLGVGQFTMGLFGMTTGTTAATIGARVLAVAIRAIPFIGLIGTVIGVATALSGMGGYTNDAANDVNALEKAQKDAQKQMESFADGLDKTGSSAKGAGEKIRTLVDYANDLESVFSRAFDIRFGGQKSLDTISKSFSSIAKSTADARDEINSLNTDIATLTADKALQEYFLSVANAYGDTLSAGQINAKLSKINADLASKNKSLASAQDKTNKTLVGNSEAAIDNRAEIIGLVKNYQDYIKSLASSGMKQDELSRKTAELQADFISQATQLGYNSDELGIYKLAFQDVAIAIDNVPRNVTIEADINPAITALNEFVKRAEQAGANAATGASNNFKSNWVDPSPKVTIKTGIQEPTPDQWASFKNNISAALNTNLGSTGNMFTELFRQGWTGGSNWGVAMPWYATGGYTGAGGKYDVAGIVHRGEYVVPKEQVNQQTGLPYYMNQPRSFAVGGYAGGQATNMMVSLSPEDRAILRSAGGSGEVVLYANNVELARSVNDGNRTIVASGGRP